METRDIVERLRESATASHGYSIDRGSVDAGLAGILADEAAAELSRLRAEVERLREALDIDKAVEAAAAEWRLKKDTEWFNNDLVYFKANWRSLPGYRDAVDREIGRRARKALEAGE